MWVMMYTYTSAAWPDFFFHHERGLNPDLTLEKLFLVLTLKTLCPEELIAGRDPLRKRVGSEASADATNFSYCAKLVFVVRPSVEAKSVFDDI